MPYMLNMHTSCIAKTQAQFHADNGVFAKDGELVLPVERHLTV